MKPVLKQKAIGLRTEGLSLLEISKKLNISKSTASLWVRDVELDFDAKFLLKIKGKKGLEKGRLVMAKLREKRRTETNLFADNLVKDYKFSNESLLLAIALIYYCEGAKDEMAGISFTNSDPGLLSYFVEGCRKVFNLDDAGWRASMHLHSYHNEADELKFWSKTLRIPASQFHKTFHKKNKGLYPKAGYRGCVRVRYYKSEYSKKLLAVAKSLFKKGL